MEGVFGDDLKASDFEMNENGDMVAELSDGTFYYIREDGTEEVIIIGPEGEELRRSDFQPTGTGDIWTILPNGGIFYFKQDGTTELTETTQTPESLARKALVYYATTNRKNEGNPFEFKHMYEDDQACFPTDVQTVKDVWDHISKGDEAAEATLECMSEAGREQAQKFEPLPGGYTTADQDCYSRGGSRYLYDTELGQQEARNPGHASLRQHVALQIAIWAHCTRNHEELPVLPVYEHEENKKMREVLICLVDRRDTIRSFIYHYGNRDKRGFISSVRRAQENESDSCHPKG